MQRIKNLNGYQKGLLLLLLAMALVFAVVYHMTIARVGVLYQNAIFVPAEENGVTVYSGKLRGKQAEFTVSADKTVSFRCDGQTYGPYTVKEDPTARPEDEFGREGMTGVEIRDGEELLFRGGFWQSDAGRLHRLFFARRGRGDHKGDHRLLPAGEKGWLHEAGISPAREQNRRRVCAIFL